MHSAQIKTIEFFAIFIATPISFAFGYPVWLKLSVGVLGFAYVVFVLLKVEKERFRLSKSINWKRFWKETAVTFLLIAGISVIYVWATNRDALFDVMLNKPSLWLLLLFIYCVFSVYPQEVLYRTFFFKRYEPFFSSKWMAIFTNALVFSLGHLFFKNPLVLFITFVGGLLFAHSFYKTQSTLLVSIQHAIYGSWLFTVGMGGILGFPV
ncbi:CPBP family intramembrane glutamic endopeptidase [Tamlana crocina]